MTTLTWAGGPTSARASSGEPAGPRRSSPGAQVAASRRPVVLGAVGAVGKDFAAQRPAIELAVREAESQGSPR